MTADATSQKVFTLPCDVTVGCTIETPMGEKILQVHSTDSKMKPEVANDGQFTNGTVNIVPASASTIDGKREVVLASEIDVQTALKTYRVIATANRSGMPHVISFQYTPQPPTKPAAPPPATGTAEYQFLDPRNLDFGYTSHGTATCVTVFVIMPNVQLWCRLHDAETSFPAAYALRNNTEEFISPPRLVAEHYLVIDTIELPIKLEWGDGRYTIIERTHE